MSKGNQHHSRDNEHIRGNFTKSRPGLFRGEKLVKKANMVISYENYNTPNKTDKQSWS